MKQNLVEQELIQILALLANALHAAKYAFMRERFASDSHWKLEGPDIKRQAYAAWHLAKQSISERKQELQAYLISNKDRFSDGDFNNFVAAIKVMEKEMEDHMERVLIDDPEIEQLEELDEDEQYVRETEGIWDGDDYVGISDDEELEDYDLIEEE